ncbi:unnamed protein product [Linum trigynum]|uniref:Uncharacterized protein n=1 Tax=Linum trigynum TaxID=586398 RepID=A0AAV2CHN8_9ROSI
MEPTEASTPRALEFLTLWPAFKVPTSLYLSSTSTTTTSSSGNSVDPHSPMASHSTIAERSLTPPASSSSSSGSTSGTSHGSSSDDSSSPSLDGDSSPPIPP